MDIAGKTIVVTGAASGIGLALAECFEQHDAAAVIAVDTNPAVADQGRTAYVADVSDEGAIARMVDEVERNVGPIDLYCSNAGIGAGAHFSDPLGEWQKSWDVNVMAHVIVARHLVPRMVARGGGYFLITASAAGLLNQIGGAAYGVTKHAAVGFGEWLALSYAHLGISVSLLCPQAVRTPMTEQAGPAIRAASLDGALEPDAMAEFVVEELAREPFLILPHAEVASYMQRKATDPDRWIAGMNRLHQQLVAESR